jgi:hypothetical protein
VVTYNPGMDGSPTESRIEISWAACPRWATFQSADLVDAVEQLGGQWAVVFVDVQGSGRGGRRLASTLLRMTREHLASGMSAETAVLAVHQHLHALRQGKVGASIHVCEVDAISARASIAGLGTLSVATSASDEWKTNAIEATPAGFESNVEVAKSRCDFRAGTRIILANDGVAHKASDLSSLLTHPQEQSERELTAECLLRRANQRDSGRPRSDMAVAVIEHRTADPDFRILGAHVSIPVKRHGSDL